MSVHTENTTDTSKTHDAKRIDRTINGFSPQLIEKRMRANLEPYNAQISTLAQLLNQLI